MHEAEVLNQVIDSPLGAVAPSFENWGLIDYQPALEKQLAQVEAVHRDRNAETLVFCSHPPVVTIGRATREGDVFSWSGEIVEVNRGGRATYHGPSQIVAYPILDLTIRGRDLHRYMRTLEGALVNTLAEFGITATGRSLQTQVGDSLASEATGVWIGQRKIASIGIGVRHWVSFHGLALNLEHDANAFTGLLPCGFQTSTMTSMEEVLGQKVNRKLVEAKLKENLLNELRVQGSSIGHN